MTSLKFDITSGWTGDGVDDAQAQLKALKQQIDDLNSKRLQITADATETQAVIADVKKQIDDLNQDIKLGVADEDAKTKLLELKAELDALNNRALAIKVDKSQADAELAALKLEMDKITQDQKIKVEVDNEDLRKSLDSARADFDAATNDMSDHAKGIGTAGKAAALNMVTALALLAPAIVPLTGAVLALGGAMVSAFSGAGIAAGVFAESVKANITTASTYNTTMLGLNNTLQSAQQRLAITPQTNTAYTTSLNSVASAQAAVNAATANGGKATAAQTAALAKAQTTLNSTAQTSSSYASALLSVQQAQQAIGVEQAKMSPAQLDLANSLNTLTNAWHSFQQAAAVSEDPLIASVFKIMASGLRELLPIIPAVTNMLKPMVAELDHFVNGHTDSSGSALEKLVDWVVQSGVPNLQRLIVFIMEVGTSLAQVATSFSSQGAGMTQWLDKIGASLDRWGANGGFTRFAALIKSEMPTIEKFLASLGLAIQHVIQTLNQFGGASLTTLSLVSELIAHLPVDVIDGLFVAFAAYKVLAAATASFRVMQVAVDAVKVAYAAGEAAVIAFSLGVEGATVAEDDNAATTVFMTAGRYASAVATGVATVATWAWTAATWAASAAATAAGFAIDLMFGPIGLIIAALAALGFAVYELVDHWSTVWHAMKTAFDDAWGGIKQGFDDVVSFMRGEWGLFVLAIPVVGWMLYVAANWKSIWSDMTEAFDTTINAFKTAWDAVSSALMGAWDRTWEAMKADALAVWNFFITVWTTQINAIKTVWDVVSSALSAAWTEFWEAAKRDALAVWDFLVSDWTDQLHAIESAWDTVSSSISGAWSTFWNDLKTGATTVWTDIESGVSGFAKGVENAFTTLVSTVGSIWSGIESVFQTPVNLIVRIWNDIAGAIGLPKIDLSSSSPAGTSNGSGYASGTDTVRTGGAVGHADGGLLRGPGTGTSDSIHAMVSNGEFIMPADKTSQHLGLLESIRQGGMPHFSLGGIVGSVVNLGKDVVGAAGSLASGAFDALKSIAATAAYDVAKPMVNAAVSAVPNPIPGVATPGGSVPHAGAQTLGDLILDKLKAAQSTAQAQAATVGGTIPTGEHLTLINEALAKAGVPQSQWTAWQAGLNTLISRESGWNPLAVNLTDSNAAAGHPSQGLMQTIPSTFAEYSLGGSITDPLSNIVAGIRYILATYGDISKVQQANANMPPKGYDTGGALMPGLTLANNTTGTVEGVLNPTGLAAIGGLNALSSLNSGRGFRSIGSSGTAAGSGGGTVVNITAPITINADGADAEQIAEMIEAEFEKLATMIEAEVGTH